MKKSLFLALALTCGASWAQDTDKKITLEARAAPINQILQQISKQANKTLVADSSMSPEVILISAKDADLNDLMRQIATVTDGTWTEIAGEFSLVPNASARAKEDSDALKVREAAIQKMIAALPADDPAGAILAQQSIASLARYLPGQRVVYSSNPTTLQVSADGITSDLVSNALNKNPTLGAQMRVVTNTPNTTGETPLDQVSKVDLSVANVGPSLLIQLTVFNSRGTDMAFESQSFEVSIPAPAYTVPDSLTSPQSKGVVESPLTKDLMGAGFGREGALTNMAPDTLNAIKHPDQNDPLSFYASDVLLQRAKECGKQVVADLPDQIFLARADTAAAYLANETAHGNLKVADDSGWMLVSPGRPALSRLDRANRSALATLVASASNPAGASMDDMSAFALAEGHAPFGVLPEMFDASGPYLKAFVHNWSDFEESGGRFLFLALLGTMTADQKIALFNYRPVPLSTFTNTGQAVLKDLILGSEGSFQIANPMMQSDVSYAPRYMPGMPLRPHMAPNAGGMLGQSYLREPTEVCASGLPSDSELQLLNSDRPGPANALTLQLHLKPQVVKACVLMNGT